MVDLRPPATRPCSSCPYRRDVPSGVWAAEEYDKLPRFDAETMFQPTGVFLCHQSDGDGTNDRLCAGWVGCHGAEELLALRFAVISGRLSGDDYEAVVDYVSPVPLFASGAEAAEHGRAEIETPGVRAVEAIGKIRRVRTNLLT